MKILLFWEIWMEMLFAIGIAGKEFWLYRRL
jgi:hypothetical protein